MNNLEKNIPELIPQIPENTNPEKGVPIDVINESLIELDLPKNDIGKDYEIPGGGPNKVH